MRTNIVLVEERKGLWFAGSLSFTGVTSRGDTKEDARKNLELTLGDMIMHNEIDMLSKEIDSEVYMKEIYTKKQKYIFSDIDIKNYLNIPEATKSERTNVSIKKGYKVLAKAKKINMSEFINDALSKKLCVEF